MYRSRIDIHLVPWSDHLLFRREWGFEVTRVSLKRSKPFLGTGHAYRGRVSARDASRRRHRVVRQRPERHKERSQGRGHF